MKAYKFKLGTQVIVTKKDGSTLNGTITGLDVNLCTFKNEYYVRYFDNERNSEWTLLGVPETAITLANINN